MKFYYAVQKGRHPGIYENWSDCQREVIGATGAVYKKFKTRAEAEDFVKGDGYDSELPFDEPEASAPSSASASRRSTGAPSGPLFHSVSDVTPEDVLQELSEVETEALAYVDGSFNIRTGVYGYGGVLLCRDGSIRPLQGHGRDETLRTMRNVAGEIHGSMAAIQAAADAGIASITIFYDYMGIEMWANGQWKTNKEGTRAYKAFIDAIRPRIEIRFQKVAAHTGVRFNELVDQLAKASVGIA
ncbi:MAG: ribonuclease H family protein [Lachnospiraceae bacterium]|nr:ribonuclease H family protein [Lachnospiraceae bacterium]